MNKLRLLLLNAVAILLLWSTKQTYAQHSITDSLLSVLKTAKEDTNTVKLLDDIAWEFIYSEPEKAITYATQELELSQKLKWKTGIALAENAIGIYYNSQGDYANTLVHFFKALKLWEELKYKKGISSSYSNIGNVYRNQDDFVKALDYYTKALSLAKETGSKESQALFLGNIGIIHAHENDTAKAFDNFSKALKLNEEIGNKIGIANCMGNIGLIYKLKGDNSKALDCFLKALQIDFETGNKNGRTRQLNNIGSLYIKQKKYKEAGEYLTQSLTMAKELGSKQLIRDNYGRFTQLDSAQGNYGKAFENYKLYVAYRDSIDNEKAREKNIQLGMQYEFDKKQASIKAEQDKKDAIVEQSRRKQQIITWSITGGLFMLLVIAMIIFRSLRVTQKQKKIISEKSDLLGEALKNVNDSITYAKRIQQAKLPKKEDINAAFPDNFILFKPKDIVSGDFYYFHQNNHRKFLAAVDCTGHGVPGAFMSLIGYEKLEEAMTNSTDTSEILKQLNKRIKSSLKQTDSDDSTRDGMDIALCEVDTKNYKVKYAGANRPLWIIRKGSDTIEEIKATKKAIGGFTDDHEYFETHEIELVQGDVFYIFSDGYADTFSGAKNKKLTTKKFKELLLSIKDKSMPEQGAFLDSFLEQWREGIDQVDDVLVMGVRM